MQRRIDLVVKDGEDLQQISGWASTAFGFRIDDRKEGIVMGGCGMDMGFALVNDLAEYLYRDGWDCPGGESCSAPHSHHADDTSIGSFRGRRYGEGVRHERGAYALKHRWL
jgi:hypothetical protein